MEIRDILNDPTQIRSWEGQLLVLYLSLFFLK